MTTILPTIHPDGFNGARDAALLERAANWKPGSSVPTTVQVQRTAATKSLLQRAGYRRTQTHAFYSVRVVRDQFNRLQLA